jgi:hypothetical protein
MDRLLQVLTHKWAGLALIGLFFWGVGWVSLRSKKVQRPLLKSGALAVAFSAATLWGWCQTPLFMGSRWVAFAPVVIWCLAIRIMSDKGWSKFQRGRRLG